MDLGINYITDKNIPENKYDEVYKILIQNNIINTLKFPGKYCDYRTLEYFMKIIKETGAKIDLHGLPGMIPAIHSNNFIKNVEWEKVKDNLINCERISSHIGEENNQTLRFNQKEIFEKNISELRNRLKMEVGLENIPGGFNFDSYTLKPEFITNCWKEADFGVFDISHAKLAAKELNITYENYLTKIGNKDKVKILHISGNIDIKGKFHNKPDKHLLIKEQEIKDIINLLNEFKNVDLVISEYAYNSEYSYEKEIIIETIMLKTIIETKNEKESIKKLQFLQKNLKEDISNIEEILCQEE